LGSSNPFFEASSFNGMEDICSIKRENSSYGTGSGQNIKTSLSGKN
jgi:hypothetical protein